MGNSRIQIIAFDEFGGICCSIEKNYKSKALFEKKLKELGQTFNNSK